MKDAHQIAIVSRAPVAKQRGEAEMRFSALLDEIGEHRAGNDVARHSLKQASEFRMTGRPATQKARRLRQGKQQQHGKGERQRATDDEQHTEVKKPT